MPESKRQFHGRCKKSARKPESFSVICIPDAGGKGGNEKVGTLPPDASTTCPVTKLDRAAARKVTTSAMSEDCPMRFDACLPKANDAPRIAHESRRDIGVEDARSDGFDRSGEVVNPLRCAEIEKRFPGMVAAILKASEKPKKHERGSPGPSKRQNPQRTSGNSAAPDVLGVEANDCNP